MVFSRPVLLVEETGVPGENLAWAGFELTTLVVIGTVCTCGCKSNYHTIYYNKIKKQNIIHCRNSFKSNLKIVITEANVDTPDTFMISISYWLSTGIISTVRLDLHILLACYRHFKYFYSTIRSPYPTGLVQAFQISLQYDHCHDDPFIYKYLCCVYTYLQKLKQNIINKFKYTV